MVTKHHCYIYVPISRADRDEFGSRGSNGELELRLAVKLIISSHMTSPNVNLPQLRSRLDLIDNQISSLLVIQRFVHHFL